MNLHPGFAEMKAPHMTDWLPVVREEYLEIPGLCLTKEQFQRLWSLDPSTCDALLDELVDTRFLWRKQDGAYARVESCR
jgi:hypothetical protein